MEQQTKTSTPSRLARFWQSLTRFFKKTALDSPSKPEADEAARQESRLHQIRESWHEFVNKNLEFPSDDNKLLNSITAHIFFARNQFQRIGQQDGRIPSRDYSILNLTTNQATLLADHVCSKLEERIVAADEKIAALSTVQQQQSATWQVWQEFQDEMTTYYHRHYQAFSLTTAAFSICFGFILMVADIPLSLALVGNFDVGTDHSDGDIWDKLADLELITFSLGIAFSTVYIKILYDEYISNRLGTYSNLDSMPARVPTNPAGGAHTQPVSLLSIKNEFRVKLVIKLLILAALLAMLVYLGWYRNMYSYFGEAQAYPTTPPKPTFAVDWVVHVRLVSFVLVTVVIPVVSGVSLSTGFAILHNCRILRRSGDKVAVLERGLQTLNNELVTHRAKRQEFAIALSKWQDPKKIDLIAREFVAFYEQGFNHTFRELYGNDLFKQVTIARNELMGALLNAKVKTSFTQTHEN